MGNLLILFKLVEVNSRGKEALSCLRLKHFHGNYPPRLTSSVMGRGKNSKQLKILKTSYPWEQLEGEVFPTLFISWYKDTCSGNGSWKLIHGDTLNWKLENDCFSSGLLLNVLSPDLMLPLFSVSLLHCLCWMLWLPDWQCFATCCFYLSAICYLFFYFCVLHDS